MFAVLMVIQWFGAIVTAVYCSPLTWRGMNSELHVHVWLAVAFGGALAVAPIYLICQPTGRFPARYLMAVAQVLFSSLFIHLTGGRIETHFHVFGSLAFLAMY